MQDEQGVLWLVKGGKRFRCYSRRSAASWNFKPVFLPRRQFEGMPDGGVLGFRDGSLLMNFGSGTVWLVSNVKRREVTDPDVFELLFRARDLTLVSRRELEIHDVGEPLDWHSLTT